MAKSHFYRPENHIVPLGKIHMLITHEYVIPKGISKRGRRKKMYIVKRQIDERKASRHAVQKYEREKSHKKSDWNAKCVDYSNSE